MYNMTNMKAKSYFRVAQDFFINFLINTIEF